MTTPFTIACIGAHPNDVELAMAGTIARMKQAGHTVYLIDLSDGEISPFATPQIHHEESAKSAEILDVTRKQLNLPNRYIEDTITNKKKLAALFRELRCQYIFTHYEYDSHPDHRAACKLTEAARFYAKLNKASDIAGTPFYPTQVLYFFPVHIKINLKPSFCVDISQHIETKRKALLAYDSQFIKKGNQKTIEDITLFNSYHGLSINCNYAEPFFIRESLDIITLSKLFTVCST